MELRGAILVIVGSIGSVIVVVVVAAGEVCTSRRIR
jgi:hypothetical protein